MEREQVAALLAQADGSISGEEMSRVLGVTRAAVWKEIEALRQEGWPSPSSRMPCFQCGVLHNIYIRVIFLGLAFCCCCGGIQRLFDDVPSGPVCGFCFS